MQIEGGAWRLAADQVKSSRADKGQLVLEEEEEPAKKKKVELKAKQQQWSRE